MFVDFNILNQLGSPSINSNTFANRPAAGQTGRLFVSTDTFEIYRDNGTTWDLIGGPGSSTITGTGTANYITKFTGTQSIGNSIMTEGTGLITITGTDPRFVVGGTDDGSSQLQTYSNVSTRWKFQVSSDNATDDPDITGYRTRGTVAAPTAILAGDNITNYSGRGYNGTNFLGGAGIDIFAEENYTAIAAGTYLTLGTTSIGATSETEKIRLTANGFLGINTSTPGARLDVHSTGTIAQFNTTSGTGNTYIAFQRTGTGLWRIGDTYNGGNNFFELHNTVLGTNALEFEAATNKSTFQAQQTYTTGLARGNYFDYNLSVAAGGSFSSPNAITALGASLGLTLAGNATIPSGARSGLDAYNDIAFTGAGTLTHTQGTQIRAYSNVTAGWVFSGSAVGTITHLAGLRALFPDNSGSAVNVTNNYALLLNDQTANTGTVTYTNRWGVYQEGASDLNYLNANLLLGSTVNNGNKLQVTGNGNLTGTLTLGNTGVTNAIINSNDGMYFNIDADSSGGSPEFMWGKQRSGAGAGGTTFMTITNAGLVGIGTSNPSNLLHLFESGANTIFRLGNNAAYDQFIYFNGNNDWSLGIDNSNSNAFVLSNSSSIGTNDRLVVTTAGDVGIGISAPQAKLNVNIGTNTNALQTITRFAANNLAGELKVLDFQYQGSTNLMLLRTQAVGTDPNFVFSVGSTEVFRTTSGNVLIGTTTNAGQKLQVNGVIYASSNITTDGFLYAKQTGGANAIIATNGIDADLSISVTATGAATKYASIQPSVANLDTLINRTNGGNVGIGVTVPSAKLEVNGAIRTSAPNTGTAANWKLGSRVAATVVLDTTQYIELDVGGTLYKLAIVT